MPVQNKKVFARENRKTNEQTKKYMYVLLRPSKSERFFFIV
jgi:hypothetical protein